MKKKAKVPQFPNNSRFITEKHLSVLQKVFTVSVGITLFLAFVLLGFDVDRTIQRKQQSEKQRAELIKEYNYWQNIVKMSPSYRDGYFNLAQLSYELGNYENARNYTDKTLAIDPNFEPALKLQKLLGNN